MAATRLPSALTRSNQELERFAHVAAHDLQEPCRTIISYAQLLERRFADTLDQDGQEFLAYLIGGAHRMRDLVTDLLAYSRVKGKAAPFAAVSCAEVVTSVVADLQRTIAEADASVVVGDLPMVSGDRPQLAQLFQNLIGNGLKYRRAETAPRVEISAATDTATGMATFTVSDNGIGIEAEYYDRIFGIFQRLHGRTQYPGTGIGLAICKKVVERHGGRMWLDSVPGQGSNFHFTLKLAP